MKRFFLTLLLVCLMGPVWAVDSGTRFNSISGQVDVRPEAVANAWKLAKLDMLLSVDDHIRTSEESSAILSFADMSTFVMKEESEIALVSPPGKDSKITLVAGKVWANVKKMMKDGSMEIDMSQAVAGIKGTNITLESNSSEDRIQVLRGMAEVMIKASRATVIVLEGEELIIKKGGLTSKTVIDVGQVQETWKKELSNLGENIQMNEVPETIRNLMNQESEEFKSLQDSQKSLTGMAKAPEADVQIFRKAAERFIGVLMEDTLILAAIQGKIDKVLANSPNAPTLATMNSYAKLVADARNRLQSYQAEVAKMLKIQFSTATTVLPEIEQAQADVSENWSRIDGLLRELAAGGNGGLSQSWFDEALSQCNDALTVLSKNAEKVQAVLDANPQDLAAQALLKQIGTYQASIGSMLKNLAVFHVESATITEMQQTEELLSSAIARLSDEISSYNSSVVGAAAEVRLQKSLAVLSDFSKSRRLYQNAQRLYESINKASSGQKYRTSEQEELRMTYERTADTFNQLGIVADELQSRLSDLESQLGNRLQ